MRLSDLDVQVASKEKRQNWIDTLDKLQQKDLKELHQFIKDNGIELSELDKKMIVSANKLNRDEIARQLTTKLKGVYASFGKNYEIEKSLELRRSSRS